MPKISHRKPISPEKILNIELEPFSFEDFSLDISDEDLTSDLKGFLLEPRFLGRFNIKEIKELLIRCGIIEKLLDLGYESLHYRIEIKSSYEHRFFIFTEKMDEDHTLLHLRAQIGEFRPKRIFVKNIEFGKEKVFIINWLLLQHIKGKVDPKRLYPGQRYKGLRMFKELSMFIRELAKAIDASATLEYPEYFHNAFLFAKHGFLFYDPEFEGKFRAVLRDLKRLKILDISRLYQKGCILNKETGSCEEWKTSEQIRPIKGVFVQYFESREYKELVKKAYNKYEFYLKE